MNKIILLSCVLLLQACGKPTMLKVSHDVDLKTRGPISEVSPIIFMKAVLTDKRADKSKIGEKKNGYGKSLGDIITENPVVTIVSNAISTGLLNNGHSVLDDGQIKIEGTVERFWFEIDTNFFTVEFTGEVKAQLEFIDSKTGKTIYQASYSGNHSKKKAGGAKKTWQSIMGKAVDNLIEDIVFDEDLAEVLGSR